MNSRWQANKIGLINFWYYDEQEFSFVKGRMLLRGSNGSGKSVTMQSVVPLLLDGNMSPERLDPFGSRDRKMTSYLLEEDDGREERTGYLYLEFQRAESDTFLTIGMGIRARRGKPLDKWYFSISDGRRIGKDFYLYKEMDEKVTLSKKELEYRLQEGGRVFDRQADYMEYVNRQIFGFETVEEYKEMIDLLIQLRTPKLSRDFKPSVINDILSESLQPLSDEDLRPMSEAIENMDVMNMNLKTRQEGRQAAEKIKRVFDRYNRRCLYEKAGNLMESRKKLRKLEGEVKGQEKEIQICRKEAEELRDQQIGLDLKREAYERERDSLNKSDAVGLKAREAELSAAMQEKDRILQEKDNQLSGKQEQYIDMQSKEKEEEEKEYQKEKEIKELLEVMQQDADDMAFEEHGFFSEELKNRLQEPFSFSMHRQQMETIQKNIRNGLNVLREADSMQRQVEELRLRYEQHQREIDKAEAHVNATGVLFIEAQNEWKEALYSWNGKNQELRLPEEVLKKFARFIEQYGDKTDFAWVRQTVADVWIHNKEGLYSKLQKNQERITELEQEYQEKKQELTAWEEHKEPEPERTEGVRKNRERLEKMGIPYQEFYKVIEFGGELDEVSCNRLEEALLYMGILDALVIDEAYREQVLALDLGCCDRYLFAGKQRAEHSLLDVLDINDGVNDLFFNQRITGILQNIAYDGTGSTMISSDGFYQIGVLTGTLTGEYEAGFLGSRAREQNRLAKIAACREMLDQLTKELEKERETAENLQKRLQLLTEEYQALPGDVDVREAFRMLKNAEQDVANRKAEGLRLEKQLREQAEKWKELQKKALEIAEKLYLNCTYETFLKADAAAQDYVQHFYRLLSVHEYYLQIVQHVQELREYQENLEFDMDQIRYDMENTRRGRKKEQEEYASILEQLKLTDYEQIKERLDACIHWLNAYPAKMKECTVSLTEKVQREKILIDEIRKGKEQIENDKRQEQYLCACFEAEKNLGYVQLSAGDGRSAEEIFLDLAAECENLSGQTLIADLNRVYFENKGLLNDYQLTQKELFEELDAELNYPEFPAKRVDIKARYQGVTISFYKLLLHLEEDIAELKELIKDGDRELFEDILANTVSRKIRGKINSSNTWVDKMNALMGSMNTSSGLKLRLRWRSKTAETEEQLDTKELVNLLKKDYRLMREEEAAKLSRHFRSKVEVARRHAKDSGGMVSFYQVMKETLDYRKWFEFQLFSQKNGEKVRELTNSVFGTFSGGEKAMAMYVPLFSAVAAKYQGGRGDAPLLISLDEAFAGVDNQNIRDMFRLMAEFQFNFMINSQVLWGDCDTLDALAIYELLRPENARFVTVMPYLWNGKVKELLENEEQMEQRAAECAG